MDPELYELDTGRKQVRDKETAQAKLEAQKSQVKALMNRNPRLRQFLPSEIVAQGTERQLAPHTGDFYDVFYGSTQQFEPQVKLDYKTVLDRRAPMDLPQFYQEVVEEVEVDEPKPEPTDRDGREPDEQSMIGDQTIILNGDMVSNLHLLGPEAKGKDFKTLNIMYQAFIKKEQAKHQVQKQKDRAERETQMRLKAEQEQQNKAKARKVVRKTQQRVQEPKSYAQQLEFSPDRPKDKKINFDPTLVKKIDSGLQINPNRLIVEFLQANPQHMYNDIHTHKFGEDLEKFKQERLKGKK